MKPTRAPVVGEFYRLPNGRYIPSPNNNARYNYSTHVEPGIYIVTSVDFTNVKLRLVSKMRFHGSGRKWIKSSKYTDELTHAEFAKEYEDDAASWLKDEFDTIKAGYATVLGNSI